MNIGIVGLGAIGSLWAVKLQQAGHQVSVYTRDQMVKTCRVQLDKYSENRFEANQYQQLAQCEWLLVAVKSTQVHAAMLPLLPYLTSSTSIIFMHNGMGAVEAIKDKITPYKIYLASTTQAAFKPQPNHVMHTGLGQTIIGPLQLSSPKPDAIEIFHQALAPVTWQDDIQTTLWTKLAINCVINPLTAIHQCNNGELAQDRFSAIVQSLIQEIHHVTTAMGLGMTQDQLTQIIAQTLHFTAKNHSSMQQDIAHQRLTEIDYITGYLIQTAKLHNIATPINQQLLSQIKQLENQDAKVRI